MYVVLLVLSSVGFCVSLALFRSVKLWGSSASRNIFTTTFGLLTLFSIIGVLLSDGQHAATSRPDSAFTGVQEKNSQLLRYHVLNSELIDYQVYSQVKIELVVSDSITKPGIEKLLHKLCDSLRALRGFKYRDSLTSIRIYAFSDTGRADSNIFRWVAMIDWGSDNPGLGLLIDEPQLAALYSLPVEKFGLPETTRKQIWQQYVLAKHRALKEAQERYPDNPERRLRVGQRFKLRTAVPLMPELEPVDIETALMLARTLPPGSSISILQIGQRDGVPWYQVSSLDSKTELADTGWINSGALSDEIKQDTKRWWFNRQVELETSLRDKYSEEIANQFGISLDQLLEIRTEAYDKVWPMPR